MPAALQADDPEPPAVSCGVVVHARIAHRLPLADRDGMPGHQERVEVEADGVCALTIERGADHLAHARAHSRHQRRTHGGRQRHTRRVIAHATPLERRGVTGAGQQVRQACSCPERRHVIGRAVGIRPALAVSGDQSIHQSRVVRGHRREVQADACERAWTDVGQEIVCVREQFGRRGASVVVREVQHNAALGPVVQLERRAGAVLDAQHPAEHPRGVTVRRFDLDDVRAPVGEYPRRGRTRHPDAEFDDLDALQGSGHAIYKSLHFCKYCEVNRAGPILGLGVHLDRGIQRIATDVIAGRVRHGGVAWEVAVVDHLGSSRPND